MINIMDSEKFIIVKIKVSNFKEILKMEKLMEKELNIMKME